jgi:hypothetical protein
MSRRPLLLLGCGGVVLLSSCADAVTAPSLHSVTGAALVDMLNDPPPLGPIPVTFQAFISAHQDAAGVWGTIEGNVFRPGLVSFSASVDCLVVDGPSAWIGATLVVSNDPEYGVGARILVLVRDRGGPGTDIMHFEPAANIGNARCTDRPVQLAETTVDEGDYDVR